MKWGKTIWSGSVKHLLFFAFFDIFSAFVIISWQKNAQAIRQNRIKQSEHTWLNDCAKHRGRYFTILAHSLLHCKFGVNFFDVWHGSWWTGIYNLKWILDLAILFCGWDLKCSVTQGFGVWSWIRLDWIKGERCAVLHATGCLFFLHSSLNNAAAVTLGVIGESWCCLCESEEQQTDQVGVDYILITSWFKLLIGQRHIPLPFHLH